MVASSYSTARPSTRSLMTRVASSSTASVVGGLPMTRRVRDALVRAVVLKRDDALDPSAYPFTIPAIRDLDELALDPAVTFFIGDNGSGKSTLVEAIAIGAKLNPEGGSRFMRIATAS